LEGELKECMSLAPHTYQWLERTWDKEYPDITYVTAHPYITRYDTNITYNAGERFGKVVEVWRTGWDKELGTTPAEPVHQALKKLRYKKAVVHYLQPHGPYIGEPRWIKAWTLGEHKRYRVLADYFVQVEKPDPDFMKRVYEGNLRYVLDEIEKNRELFKGKTVISADHGELLGEEGLYLHKHGYPPWADKLLKKIPWFEWDK
jgi:hypothetical protein